MIEPEIETIDLRLDSDPDEVTQDDPKSNDSARNALQNEKIVTSIGLDKEVKIKQEPPDFQDGLSNVQILATTHVPEGVLDESSNSKDIEIEKELRIQTLAAQLSKFMESTQIFVEPIDCEKVYNTDKELNGDNETDQLIKEKVDTYLKNKPKTPNTNETARAESITESSKNEILKSKQAIIDENTENLIRSDDEEPAILINDDFVDDEEAGDLIRAKAEEYCKKFEIKVNKTSTNIEIKAKMYADEYIEKMQEIMSDSETEDLIKAKADNFVKNKEVKSKPDFKSLELNCNDVIDEEDFVNDIIKQKADDFIRNTDKNKLAANVVKEIQFPLDVDIDDEGIEFIDDGIEYIEEDDDCAVDKNGKIFMYL